MASSLTTALKPSSSVTASIIATLPEGRSFQDLISFQDSPLPEKVDNFVSSVSLFAGNLFSSEKFYQVVQVTLLTSSCIGIVGAIGLLALGMPSFSLMMISLSSTTAIGAYLAGEISSHKTFESSAEKIQGERERLGLEVDRLNIHLEELERVRDDLQQGVSDLKAENVTLKKNLQKLDDVTDDISRIKEIIPTLAKAASQAEADRKDFASIKPLLEILPKLVARFDRLETDVQQIKKTLPSE